MTIDDPVLLAMRKRLQESRSRFPLQTSASAYEQQRRSLMGMTLPPRSGDSCATQAQSEAESSSITPKVG